MSMVGILTMAEDDAKMDPALLAAKIRGIAAGARAYAATADEMRHLEGIIKNTARGSFELVECARTIADTPWDDGYMKAIVANESYGMDPAAAVNMVATVVDAPTGGEIGAYLRAAWLGMFTKWDEYAITSTMLTHLDSRTITTALIISKCVRDIICGQPTALLVDIPQTIELMIDMDYAPDDVVAMDSLKHELLAAIAGDAVPQDAAAAALWVLHRHDASLIPTVPADARMLAGALLGASGSNADERGTEDVERMLENMSIIEKSGANPAGQGEIVETIELADAEGVVVVIDDADGVGAVSV
jgi:hypothetical protein